MDRFHQQSDAAGNQIDDDLKNGVAIRPVPFTTQSPRAEFAVGGPIDAVLVSVIVLVTAIMSMNGIMFASMIMVVAGCAGKKLMTFRVVALVMPTGYAAF